MEISSTVDRVETFDVNSLPTILALVMMAAITPSASVIGPLIVGNLVTDLGFSAQQAGTIVGTELIGAGLATLLILVLVSRVSWRSTMYAAFSVIAAGNVLSAFILDFNTLVSIRLVVGVGVGLIMAKTLIIVGMTSNQTRVMGYWAVGQVIFSVIAFAGLPHIFPIIGMRGFYISMAVVMVLFMLLVRHMPPEGSKEHKAGFKSLSPEVIKLAPIGLLAMLLFFIGLGSVWAYVERMADAAGFSATTIGYILSIASFAGVLGASAASYMGGRFGLWIPTVGGYLGLVIAMILLFSLGSAINFGISSFIYKYAWWFVLPYLLANMTMLDASGRLIILTNFTIGIGVGAGPVMAAYLLTAFQESADSALNFSPVLFLGITSMIASCILLTPIIKANSGKEIELANAH